MVEGLITAHAEKQVLADSPIASLSAKIYDVNNVVGIYIKKDLTT